MPGKPFNARARFVLAAGFLVLFMAGGARLAVGLTLKPNVEQFGWGRSDLGAAVALFMLVSAVAIFVAGHVADRMNPRAVLGGGLLVSGVGIGAMSTISARVRLNRRLQRGLHGDACRIGNCAGADVDAAP